MNEENYKSIAKIINQHIIGSFNERERGRVIVLCKDLSNYFEKKNPLRYFHGILEGGFIKEQFLKNCGIKE